MGEELKPCPFCGDEGDMSFYARPSSADAAGHFVECVSCGASGPSFEIQGEAPDRVDYTKGKAIAAWNTRTPTERPVREIIRPGGRPTYVEQTPLETEAAAMLVKHNCPPGDRAIAAMIEFRGKGSVSDGALAACITDQDVIDYTLRFYDENDAGFGAETRRWIRALRAALTAQTPPLQLDREAVARIIVGFGPPSAKVGPATQYAWDNALAKADAILSAQAERTEREGGR